MQIVGGICFSADCQSRWFPEQKVPSSVVKLSDMKSFPENVLAQSLSGLAAQCVNDGTSGELVWIQTDSVEYKYLFDATIRRLEISEIRECSLWDLTAAYFNKGIVKGYILYSQKEEVDCDSDCSINIATGIAGLLKGVLVEEGLEYKAMEMGLKKLYDARGKKALDVFERYKEQFNRNLVLAVAPSKAHMRDMAIAHRTMAVYGTDETVETIYQWLNPPSAVLGWNKGDEYGHVSFASKWGLFETVSDWCLNIPILSAGSEQAPLVPVKHCRPWEIDFDDTNDAVAFLFSDGDNLQWNMGGFNFNERFWANEHHGQFPMSWSTASASLAQVSPETLNYRSETQPSSTAEVEFSGGYFYPDLFAVERSDRKQLIRTYAKKLSKELGRTGVNVVCMLCEDVRSQNAKDVYEIFAEELQGIIGMIALQYYPYDGGDGEVFWFSNKQGIDIPLITVKYTAWNNASWERGGNIKKIADLIKAQKQNRSHQTFSVVANHAWSKYEIDGRKLSGLDAVKNLYDQLKADVRVMNIEELIWRLRMQHDPQQTKNEIDRIRATNLLN